MCSWIETPPVFLSSVTFLFRKTHYVAITVPDLLTDYIGEHKRCHPTVVYQDSLPVQGVANVDGNNSILTFCHIKEDSYCCADINADIH